jgi:hypothetical protein
MGDYIMIDRSAHFAKSTVRRKVVGIDSALRLDFLALFTLLAVVVHGRIFKARRVAVLGHHYFLSPTSFRTLLWPRSTYYKMVTSAYQRAANTLKLRGGAYYDDPKEEQCLRCGHSTSNCFVISLKLVNDRGSKSFVANSLMRHMN